MLRTEFRRPVLLGVADFTLQVRTLKEGEGLTGDAIWEVMAVVPRGQAPYFFSVLREYLELVSADVFLHRNIPGATETVYFEIATDLAGPLLALFDVAALCRGTTYRAVFSSATQTWSFGDETLEPLYVRPAR